MKILIKNGYLLDPATNREGKYDVLIEEDKIIKVDREIKENADKVLDVQGKYVMPGFLDLHVHLREPGFTHKETIKTGAMAAAKGGFTGICSMPNTKPVIDTKESIDFLCQKAQEDAIVNIYPIGAITKGELGEELSEIIEMGKNGAKAISEDGKSVMDVSLYLKAMKLAKQANIPIMAHCEDKVLVKNGVLNAGKKAEELGMEGILNSVEDIIVARDILLAKEAKAQLHLCHCSTADSAKLVKMGKELGVDVTAEVCPHHFTLTDEDIPGDNANYKMNPPLRSKKDVQALKEGLRDNIFDVIATDHAPHAEEEKKLSIKEAPFGIVGLETAFALTVTELVDKGYLTPMQMVEKLSVNPARIIHVDRGSLLEGKTADLVIADMDTVYTIDVNQFVSKAKNTPFHGKKVKGRIEITLVNGKIVYNREERI